MTIPSAILLLSALLPWQRPQMPGKLAVISDPPGAVIAIDSQRMPQPTDFTFIVSPGSHTVALTSAAPPKCATPLTVLIRSNAVATIRCTASGWSGPTYK